MSAKKSGLGKGLSALIREVPAEDIPAEEQKDGIVRVPVDRIARNPFQPRMRFDQDALDELVRSIRDQGIIQPLVVRRSGDEFELIAGERRLRAAIAAELREVPVIIREATDREALELALIENLLRENLNPLEEAQGYRDLMDRFNLTQEQVSQRVGRSRAAVANSLRILHLPEDVRQLIADEKISGGHAKALAGLDIPQEQSLLAERASAEGLSVRQLERIIQRQRRMPKKPRAEKLDIPASHLSALTQRLQQHLGTAVSLSPCKTLSNGKKVKGRIEIEYYSNDELDRLLAMMGLHEDL